MQVYKTFFKVMKQYRVGILLYIVINIVMLMMLINSSTPQPETVEMTSYGLLVVDEDHSEFSEEFVGYLDEMHDLKEGTYTDDQIKDMLYYQSITEYIVIPKGFEDAFYEYVEAVKNHEASSDEITEKLLKGTYDEAMPRGLFVNMQMNQYLNSVADYLAEGKTLDYASEKTKEALDPAAFVTMMKQEMPPAEISYTAFLFLPYGILSIIFTCVLPVIISFNEKEKKNRTIVSSMKMNTRNIALILGAATLAIVVTIILVGFATAADGAKFIFTKAWWLSVANAFIYTLTTTMLLSMISTLPIGIEKTVSGNTSAFITNIIGLSFSFLGGTFVDLTILGDNVAKVGRFIPNYWYSIASRKIWYENAPLSELLPSFGLQLLFGIVCLSIGLVFTKFFGDRAASN